MIFAFEIFVVETRLQNRGRFQNDENRARHSFVNFERVKIIDDRMFEMRFEQLVKIVRRVAQIFGQTVKLFAREMLRDKAGNVRALSGVMKKAQGDGAFAFERVINVEQIRDRKRKNRDAGRAFKKGERAHPARIRRDIAVADCKKRDAAKIKRLQNAARAGFVVNFKIGFDARQIHQRKARRQHSD